MKKRLKILVVDDEPAILSLLGVLLTPDYDVMLCHNVNEGLKLIENDQWNLIITDWNNPVIDGGAQIIKHLHENQPGVPVIVMTGCIDNVAAIRGTHKPTDLICKPFAMKQLMDAVKLHIK